MGKRWLVIGAGILLAAAGGMAWWQLHERRPAIRNVVLISLDTTRSDHLSCYGFPRETTPHLDALAQRGVRFEHATSPIPMTLPAHSSMLTGLIPPVHGVHGNYNYSLRPDVDTLATVLQRQGFDTAGFISSFVLDHRFGLARGFSTYDDKFENKVRTDYGVERHGAETAARAVSWLRGHAQERFFLFVHLYDPHEPYEPPEPYASRFADDPYAGEVATADAAAGMVLDALHELGLDESTLVVVAGDHGEMLGEHGELTHTYFIYRGVIEVPLLIAGPGVIHQSVVAKRVGLVDIVPTVCSMVGVAPPSGIQGRDLSRWLEKAPADADEQPYYCESTTPTRYGANPLLGIVDGNLEYIRTTRPELYDLAADPDENHNLVTSRKDAVRRLEAALASSLALASAGNGSRASTDREAAEKLRTLGYVGGGELDDKLTVEAGRDDPKDLIGLHVLHQRAIMAVANGKLDLAEQLSREIVAERPDFWESYDNLGQVAMRREQWESAKALIHKSLELHPEQYRGHFELGTILSMQQRFDEAVEQFRVALPLDPNPPDARFNLARALKQAGNLEEAASQLEEVQAATPNQPRVVNELAEVLSALGRPAAAQEILERAIAAHPDDAAIRFNLAQVQLRNGDSDGAMVQLRNLTASGDPQARDRAAALLEAAGRSDLAVSLEPRRSAAEDPLVAAADLLSARRPAQAEEALRAVLAREPDNAKAHDLLGVALAHQGRMPEALAELQRAVELAPSSAGPQLNLAMALLQSDGPEAGLDAAVPHLEKAVALDPELADAHFNLGVAYALLGRTEAARAELVSARDLASGAGNSGLAQRASDELAKLGR